VDLVLVVLVLAVVVAVVAWPLYHARSGPEPGVPGDVAGLEAARDAKFREIRDAELDFRTGKLSEEDFRTTDAQLRAEAAAILHALDEATGS